MNIIQMLDAAIKDAMKKGETFRLGVLRLIKTDAKNKEIELMHPLTEPDFFAVLSRMVNQRKESVEQFTKGGRTDLAQNEEREIVLVQEFLPKPLTDEEVASLIAAAIQKTGAQGPKGMGLVMKEIKEVTTGRVDGKALSEKVKAMLGT